MSWPSDQFDTGVISIQPAFWIEHSDVSSPDVREVAIKITRRGLLNAQWTPHGRVVAWPFRHMTPLPRANPAQGRRGSSGRQSLRHAESNQRLTFSRRLVDRRRVTATTADTWPGRTRLVLRSTAKTTVYVCDGSHFGEGKLLLGHCILNFKRFNLKCHKFFRFLCK